MKPPAQAPPIRKLTRNVIVLGFVSLFTDLASEMLYPIMPLFLVQTLGSSPAILGLVDGIAEGISTGLRWIAGAISDRSGRRKPFVVAGYSISALSKPVMGLAAYAVGWPLFLVGRSSDRLGKSIRTSARDALIADSTDSKYWGLAFGFHRAMDTCGAVAGPLVALAIIVCRPDFPLAWLFFIALLPGLLSASLAAVAVRDIPQAAKSGAAPPSIFQSFPLPFWHLLIANAIFSRGNSSDTFLLLRSRNLGLSIPAVILAFAIYNAVYALGSMPLGKLSDAIGRRPIIAAGWLIYAGVYFGFAAAKSTLAPWILLAVYGLYQALTDGVSKAMVSDVVPKHQRAGAIGLFYTASGAGQLAASLLAGTLWDVRLLNGRLMAPFVIGALCALIAAPMIATVPTRKTETAGE
jgi:MFS family permease